MSSKTKIVVLHVKELVYTGMFLFLCILFIILLVMMFRSDKDEPKATTECTDTIETEEAKNLYTPGVYTTSLVLNDQVVDIEVTVDREKINDIRMVNLEDAVATMYPLLKPSFENLATQIIDTQSLDNVTYTDDSKYTSMVLLNTISTTLEKATDDSQTLSETP